MNTHKKQKRPYFNLSIVELESLFHKSQQQHDVLTRILHELSHRKTSRADKLSVKINETLAVLSVHQAIAPTSSAIKTPSSITAVNSLGRDVVPSTLNAQHPPDMDASQMPIINTAQVTPSTAPIGANQPAAILAAWTALEALSPRTYRNLHDLTAGDRSCVAKFNASNMPWDHNQRSRPNKQLYYHIVLGAVNMELATESLIKVFGENEEQNNRIREKAVIAAVLVDRQGILLPQNAIAVSSFSWALPLALKQQLNDLGSWPKVEQKIVAYIDEQLRRFDTDGNPLPIDYQAVIRVYQWLLQQFNLPDSLVEPPTYALHVYHYYKAKNPPEALLLNSFFLGDLARSAQLISDQKAPAGLSQYVGIGKPLHPTDLLTNQSALEQAVAPAMIPAARWPSPGGHPLVLLQ